MSYCVRCGVELEAGTSACPLCKTPVIDPTAPPAEPVQPLYPKVAPEGIPKPSRRVLFILSSIFLAIPAFVTLACDLSLAGAITWSGFVLMAEAIVLFSIALGLFVRKMPAYGKILLIGALWSSYTFFVEYRIHEKLRIPFAFPLVVYATLMIAALCLYGRLTRRRPRPLMMAALFFLLAGGFCVLIEGWVNGYFSITPRMLWSIYPAGTSLLLAALLTVLHRSKSLKAALKQKLFV